MKLLVSAFLALSVSYAAAECNNMCSGHGTCGANDACTCYRNWRGADCSERTCQYAVSFVETPQGDLDHDGAVETGVNVKTQWSSSATFEGFTNYAVDNTAHAYMECSNKGLCDRSTGECVCFDGYEGSACQRTACPNACSGNGVCRNLVDLSWGLSALNREGYPLWDGLKNQVCVCDPGFSGVDCSQRLCPANADPLIDGKVYQSQTLTVTPPVTKFTIVFTDGFGEKWTTASIEYSATPTTLADNIYAGLTGLPNRVVEFSSNSVVACVSATSCRVTWTKNAGVLPLMTVSTDTGSIAVTDTSGGSVNTQEECSFRGLCDYNTGLCKCFRGYRTEDCHEQYALQGI